MRVKLPTAGSVTAVITNERGGPVPCKIQFRGTEGSTDPFFFDKSGEHAVGNLYYSHNGTFLLDLPPGKYDCTISHGPEYDVVERPIEVLSGSRTPLTAELSFDASNVGPHGYGMPSRPRAAFSSSCADGSRRGAPTAWPRHTQ